MCGLIQRERLHISLPHPLPRDQFRSDVLWGQRLGRGAVMSGLVSPSVRHDRTSHIAHRTSHEVIVHGPVLVAATLTVIISDNILPSTLVKAIPCRIEGTLG